MIAGKAIDAILYLKELVVAYQDRNAILRRGLAVISQKSPDEDIRNYANAILEKEKDLAAKSKRHSEESHEAARQKG